jgi:hypothetical protein
VEAAAAAPAAAQAAAGLLCVAPTTGLPSDAPLKHRWQFVLRSSLLDCDMYRNAARGRFLGNGTQVRAEQLDRVFTLPVLNESTRASLFFMFPLGVWGGFAALSGAVSGSWGMGNERGWRVSRRHCL